MTDDDPLKEAPKIRDDITVAEVIEGMFAPRPSIAETESEVMALMDHVLSGMKADAPQGAVPALYRLQLIALDKSRASRPTIAASEKFKAYRRSIGCHEIVRDGHATFAILTDCDFSDAQRIAEALSTPSTAAPHVELANARQALREQADEIVNLRVRLRGLVDAEKAKADAYEDAARIAEEMSYPPEGQERWHGTDNEWAAIKLEDAAKAIRERKAKVCHVTQAARSATGDTAT